MINDKLGDDELEELSLKDEPKDQPAVTAGLTGDQLGANATPNPSGSTIEAPDNAQDLRNQDDQKASPYGFDPAAQKAQYNDGMSGAAEGKTNTTYSANATRRHEERKKEAEATRLNAAVQNAINTVNELADALNKLDEQLNDLKAKSQKSALAVNAIEEQMNPRITELEDLLEKQQEELEALQKSGASAEEIEIKNLEIENTNELLTLYKTSSETLSEDYRNASEKIQTASENIQSIREEIALYGGEDNIPGELRERYEQAQEQLDSAQTDLSKVNSRAEFVQNRLDRTSGSHASMTMSCMSLEALKEENIALKQQTAIMAAVISATEDGDLDQNEMTQLSEMVNFDNLSDDEVQNFADEFAKSQITIETGDGRVSGEAAASFILSEYDKIKAEKEAELSQTREQLAASEATQNEKLQIIEESTLTADMAAEKIDTLKVTGSADDKASVEIGVATVGDNQSLVTEYIIDKDGNKVHVDRSGDTESYYYLDDNGERQPYEEGDPQILNFENRMDGDSPLMSSISSGPLLSSSTSLGSASALNDFVNGQQQQSSAPVRVFANEEANLEAYEARIEQVEAEKIVQASQQQLEDLNIEVEQLKQQEGLLVADIAEIERIQGEVQNGTMSLAEAQGLLEGFDQNETNSNEEITGAGQEVDETLTLETPEYDFQAAETNINNTLAVLEQAKHAGGTIAPEVRDELLDLDGITEDNLEEMLDQTGVKVSNTPENSNGISPAGMQRSFASTLEPTESDTIPSYADTAPLSLAFSQVNETAPEPKPETIEPAIDPNDPRYSVAKNDETYTLAGMTA